MTRYQHTQTGHTILISLAILMIVVSVTPVTEISIWMSGVIYLVSIVLALLFGWLTVTVDDEHLRLRFGIGLIRKSFRLSDFVTVQAVTNPWYLGWGIHKMRKGWIYNVSGFRGIEVTLKNSRMVRIGSDEPEILVRSLTDELSQNEAKEHTARSIRSRDPA